METISRNLEELKAFHVVATAGGFTRASHTLGDSKAMLSKQVKRLESHMNTQLFHRTTRKLSLTESGAALLTYSQKIFELSDEASRRLKDMNQGRSGLVRISAPVSLGEVIFPSLLATIRVALPRVKLDFDLSNESRNITEDAVDFALRATEAHHPDLIARRLGRIKDVICASPAYLKKNKVGTDPASLAQHDCILHSIHPGWNLWTLHPRRGRHDTEVRVEASGRLSTNQYPMARELCLAGAGVVRIPLYLVAGDIETGRLVPLFDDDYEVATHPLFLVYLRSEFATEKHKIIKDLILDWFKVHREFFVS